MAETIYTRPDGTKYKIVVSSYKDGYNGGKMKYRYDVYKCLPGKRKFNSFIDDDSYQFRSLSMEDREKSKVQQYLKEVTAQEINNALRYEWEANMPEYL